MSVYLVRDTWYLCSTRSKKLPVYLLNNCVPLILNYHPYCLKTVKIITCVDSKLIQPSPPPPHELTGSLSCQCHLNSATESNRDSHRCQNHNCDSSHLIAYLPIKKTELPVIIIISYLSRFPFAHPGTSLALLAACCKNYV